MQISINIYVGSLIEVWHILLHYVVFMVDSVLQQKVDRSDRCACKQLCTSRKCGCKSKGIPCKQQCLCWQHGCENSRKVILNYYLLLLLTYNYKIQRDLFICSTAYSQFLSKLWSTGDRAVANMLNKQLQPVGK
jgi:hypothetical protein